MFHSRNEKTFSNQTSRRFDPGHHCSRTAVLEEDRRCLSDQGGNRIRPSTRLHPEGLRPQPGDGAPPSAAEKGVGGTLRSGGFPLFVAPSFRQKDGPGWPEPAAASTLAPTKVQPALLGNGFGVDPPAEPAVCSNAWPLCRKKPWPRTVRLEYHPRTPAAQLRFRDHGLI